MECLYVISLARINIYIYIYGPWSCSEMCQLQMRHNVRYICVLMFGNKDDVRCVQNTHRCVCREREKHWMLYRFVRPLELIKPKTIIYDFIDFMCYLSKRPQLGHHTDVCSYEICNNTCLLYHARSRIFVRPPYYTSTYVMLLNI